MTLMEVSACESRASANYARGARPLESKDVPPLLWAGLLVKSRLQAMEGPDVPRLAVGRDCDVRIDPGKGDAAHGRWGRSIASIYLPNC